MHNPELHALAAVNWQYFCSFSFRSEKHCARFGPQMFVALYEPRRGVSVCIFLKYFGASGANVARPLPGWHQHAVIAGLPPSAGPRNCLALMSQWESLGGGNGAGQRL
jgi:hypothetical protein